MDKFVIKKTTFWLSLDQPPPKPLFARFNDSSRPRPTFEFLGGKTTVAISLKTRDYVLSFKICICYITSCCHEAINRRHSLEDIR